MHCPFGSGTPAVRKRARKRKGSNITWESRIDVDHLRYSTCVCVKAPEVFQVGNMIEVTREFNIVDNIDFLVKRG